MYKQLVKYGLKQNCKFTVTEWEPEEDECDVFKSTSYNEIIENIEGVDECQLFVYDDTGEYLATFHVIPCNGYEESISDYTITEWTNAAEAEGVC